MDSSALKNCVTHVKELDEFEDCMLDMIQRIEFKTNHHPNKLQTKLGKDVKEIRKDKHIFVKADKTTHHYKTEAKSYNTLLNKNVTKTYKKACRPQHPRHDNNQGQTNRRKS